AIEVHEEHGDGRYRLLPRTEFLGTEELSAWSPPIRERVAQLYDGPFAGLSADALDELGIDQGDPVELESDRGTLALPARAIPGLADGAVIVPAHLTSEITAFIAGTPPKMVRLRAAGEESE
ncbi:MAG: molybdopterin dinucleotide binding domain-containing protein, partial [Candidatus Wenzhouxiangella sp. M2_3B_020]